MKNFLSPEERKNLKVQHKKERDKRICYRINAVLLADMGWSNQQIAEALLLSDESIRQHIQDYQDSRKIKPENGGSISKLNANQTEALLKHLQEHTYLYSKDIVAYIKAIFGIEYTIPGITAWLKSHEFSYKKPAIVPGKANQEAQEQWIKDYEAIKKHLPADEAICFIDGVHPTHNTKPAYGWIQKGVRKEIPTNTGRQRLNLSGALDIISKKVLVQEDLTLNARSTITFFEKIENAYPKALKVHIFCDNARYYKNKEVQKYIENSKIKLHFLPPYSPNLNPIERLWKLMNEEILYNKYYEKFIEFKVKVLDFLGSLLNPSIKLLEKLEKRLTDSFRVVGKMFKTENPVGI
jgi:transposase